MIILYNLQISEKLAATMVWREWVYPPYLQIKAKSNISTLLCVKRRE